MEKLYLEKSFRFFYFISKCLIFPSALKKVHLALQNMKYIIIFPIWGLFLALLGPDPLTRLNPDP
jgi:hypothetical protein